MEDQVHAIHRFLDAVEVADVANIKAEFVAAVLVAHVVLFLLVAAEDADLADVGVQKATQDGVAKAAGAAGDEQGFVFKHIGKFLFLVSVDCCC